MRDVPHPLPTSFAHPVGLVAASVPRRTDAKDATAGWAGVQGVAYTDPSRNPSTVEGVNQSYTQRFGITRTEVNEWALVGVPRDASVLEVGCAHGPQLNVMAACGFTNLAGCDVNADAIKLCTWPTKVADGRSLPYEDASFDLVMTSGTLMQIPPGGKAMFADECYRVARRWVYGVEGASMQPGTWNFGDLIPPAWTDLVPESIEQPGWKVVRVRWLDPIPRPGGGTMSLRVYLLEKEG